MIKVLQVVGDLNYGGVEAVIMNYYRHIDHNCVQFDFITTTQNGRFEDEIRQLGGNIFRVPRKSKHPFQYIKRLSNIIKENKYDIVHSNTNSASAFLDLYAAKKGGCKVRIAHSHNTSCLVKWQHYLLKPLLPTVVTNRLACSDEAAKWLFGNNKNYRIVNNGVDFDKFGFDNEKRNAVRESLKWQDDFVIGNVASFQDRKNQRFLIELMPELLKKIHNAKLVLVGKGDTQNDLIKLSKEIGVEESVEFLGTRDDVDKLLQGFDVFCFPSLFEGLAVAYVEAIASGLPVIISDGVPYVNIGNAVTRLELDKDKWVEKILHINENHSHREPFSYEERVRSNYDIKILADNLKNYYLGLVDNE